MGSRSGKHHRRRYDDPYVYDDPYQNSTSPVNSAAYEYVGTEEPPAYSEPPHQTFSPDHEPRRRPSPSRRLSRTTSPPRRSRHHRTSTPPPKSERSKTARRTSPHHRGSKHEDDKYVAPAKRHRYHNLTERPAVQRIKPYGRQGLHFLGEAAAMYAAAQAGENGEDRRPVLDDPYDSEPPRRRHRSRRYSPSPSPSPSPPRRRHSTRHGGRERSRPRASRHASYSLSPPPLSRDVESDYERERGRSHRRPRHRSYTPSPSPSPPRRRRGRSGPSSSSGFRSTMRDHSRMPDGVAATRWQMAARAALEAGGVTAFRLRKEPGSWTGDKGAKIATAALGAAAIDAFIDKDPRHAKSTGGMKGMAENALSAALASKLMGFKGSSTRKEQRR
ncbi:hypothetical protein F4778DRAFT_55391 [Xylariomycetidae sp. FL2044]|nr:hypothetical protein F4778DRAFT_55391 [Xylariomycetidae sp. FL2044]